MNRKGPTPGLVGLANCTIELIRVEREKFSPVLNKWHPLAASLVAATLHSYFSRKLKTIFVWCKYLHCQTNRGLAIIRLVRARACANNS